MKRNIASPTVEAPDRSLRPTDLYVKSDDPALNLHVASYVTSLVIIICLRASLNDQNNELMQSAQTSRTRRNPRCCLVRRQPLAPDHDFGELKSKDWETEANVKALKSLDYPHESLAIHDGTV
jgi:hypothetical protein